MNAKDYTKEQLNLSLQALCAVGDLEGIKYNLTSPELKEHGNINYSNGICLEFLFMNDHIHVFEYLIFDYKLQKSTVLNRLLKIHNDETSEKIKSMFKIRDMNTQLKEELPNNGNDVKKLKL